MAEALPTASLSARARLVMAFILAFGIAALQNLVALPIAVALAIGALVCAPERRAVLYRLRPAALLALMFLIVLPFITSGETLVQSGPLRITKEGAHASMLIAGRMMVIVTLVMVLLAPVSAFRLVGALRALGLPALIADLAMLTLRYLDEVTAELQRARVARALRGGATGLRGLPDHALLLATSLIRAQIRAERLWAAMRLRGYGMRHGTLPTPLAMRDWTAIAGTGAVALALVALDRSL